MARQALGPNFVDKLGNLTSMMEPDTQEFGQKNSLDTRMGSKVVVVACETWKRTTKMDTDFLYQVNIKASTSAKQAGADRIETHQRKHN